jgi:DNA-binding NtrC family response regulator
VFPNTSIEVNFRLISATNRPLDQFVRDSRFREDLYYRVNAFSIRLPSLRERTSDIPVLAQRFLARYCAANGLQLDAKSFSKEAVDLLIRTIGPVTSENSESTVSRAALSSPGRVIRAGDIEFLHASETPIEAAREQLPSLADAERAHIVRVLERAVEQASRERAGNQPRHAVPKNCRVWVGGRPSFVSKQNTSPVIVSGLVLFQHIR